jgi:hypothetical protein
MMNKRILLTQLVVEMSGKRGMGSEERDEEQRSRSGEPGAGSQERGARSGEPGAGSQEWGARSGEPGAGSQEQGARSEELGS